MKKSIAALALAGTIALTGTAPAMAANYPAPSTNSAVSDGVVGPGRSLHLFRQGLLRWRTPDHPGNAREQPRLPRAQALLVPVQAAPCPARSAFTLRHRRSTQRLTLPAQFLPLTINEPGTYTITATGVNSGVTSAPVTVTVGRRRN
jgi:hypothetical protein